MRAMRLHGVAATGLAAASVSFGAWQRKRRPACEPVDIKIQSHTPQAPRPKTLTIDGIGEFSTIIVGGGTAGCTCAYLLAKWMEENEVAGNVLLIDRGVSYSPQAGPSPRMELWYDNWCEFGECHEAVNKDGSAYPVVPSDHRGLGGCSTHDTRITFQLRHEQKKRIAREMGWTVEQLDVYFQTALNFMPLSAAIDKDRPIPFYDAVMASLTDTKNDRPLKRLPNDEHKSGIVVDSVAASSLAMYADGGGTSELRWTPTYFTLDGTRPSKLKIITDAVVDRIEFDSKPDAGGAGGDLVATGVSIIVGGEALVARLPDGGGGRVALTSGAIGSVAVLQRSGVGPSAHLDTLGIPVLVDNDSVGHGIDHEEIAVLYEWLDKWNTPEGEVPRGGAMGWPLVIFASFLPELKDLYSDSVLGWRQQQHQQQEKEEKEDKENEEDDRNARSSYFQAHFGAGYAEPYTSFPSVVATPNCLRPDHSETGGYRVYIRSRDPRETCLLVQGDHRRDLETIAQGVYSIAHLFSFLEKDGVIGRQLEPQFPITADNRERLIEWIKENHYTVFHWACTCQAGLRGRVADEHFRLRNRASPLGVVPNLFIGSAASLPEVSEANPHLTISAFAVALAQTLARSTALGWAADIGRSAGPGGTVSEIAECAQARADLLALRAAPPSELQRGHGLSTVIRRDGEERPLLGEVARKHHAAWEQAHAPMISKDCPTAAGK